LYIPEVARGFIGHAIGAISGGAQYRRSSFLLDAVGETLFPDFVNIQERPHLPGAMASAPYDGERRWITKPDYPGQRQKPGRVDQ